MITHVVSKGMHITKYIFLFTMMAIVNIAGFTHHIEAGGNNSIMSVILSGKCQLIDSSAHGDMARVLQELDRGTDVNAQDKYGRTALIWAADLGHSEVVKLLLQNPKIDVNAQDKYRRTALVWAAEQGHSEIVKLLLLAPGIDANAINVFGTALTAAACNGHSGAIKLLLQAPNINVNIPGVSIPLNVNANCKKTPLALATANGHSNIVKLLLQVPGIDVNAIDEQGKTALTYAIDNSNIEIIKLLLQVPGIDVNGSLAYATDEVKKAVIVKLITSQLTNFNH